MATPLRSVLRSWIERSRERRAHKARSARIRAYHAGGRLPWTTGYHDWREDQIRRMLGDPEVLAAIRGGAFPEQYGVGLDERIAEYGWLFSQMRPEAATFLDAGSTFNFAYLLDSPNVARRQTYIYTFYPENPSFPQRRVSYVYGDLRTLPFRDGYFDEVVCQSTLEHIDMDNSMYGYAMPPSHASQERSYGYLAAVSELVRVLRPGGQLLITVPFGAYENHGFFQQFDGEMLERLLRPLHDAGEVRTHFLRYTRAGWTFAAQEACSRERSHNPHTGRGKLDDGAAHCRAVCCVAVTRHA
jgi:SAM-dependent methyltransferase